MIFRAKLIQDIPVWLKILCFVRRSEELTTLPDLQGQAVFVPLDAKDSARDVDEYIGSRLRGRKLSGDETDALRRKSDGNFLVAANMFEQLQSTDPSVL